MKTASVTETKNQLSALLDRVRAGETVLILDRGVPVARLEPVSEDADPTGRMQRLERAGIIHAGRGAPPIERLREPLPKLAPGVSAVAMLLEERRSGW